MFCISGFISGFRPSRVRVLILLKAWCILCFIKPISIRFIISILAVSYNGQSSRRWWTVSSFPQAHKGEGYAIGIILWRFPFNLLWSSISLLTVTSVFLLYLLLYFPNVIVCFRHLEFCLFHFWFHLLTAFNFTRFFASLRDMYFAVYRLQFFAANTNLGRHWKLLITVYPSSQFMIMS